MHLLAEISAKRGNFFEAASVLGELRSALTRTFDAVQLLREKVRSCWLYALHICMSVLSPLAQASNRQQNLLH